MKKLLLQILCLQLSLVAQALGESVAPPPVAEAPSKATLPKPITQASPDYPESLAYSGKELTAKAQFTIGTDGKVTDIEIISASEPAFAESVQTALAKWTFTPATLDGQPVAKRVANLFKLGPPPEQLNGIKFNNLLKRAVFAPAPANVTDSESLEEKPTPLNNIGQPGYPKSMLSSGKAPRVPVTFIITPKGDVINPVASGGAPDAFKFAAIVFVANIKYWPTRVNGKSAYIRHKMNVQFKKPSEE